MTFQLARCIHAFILLSLVTHFSWKGWERKKEVEQVMYREGQSD